METIRTNRSLNFTFGVLKLCGFWMPSSFVGTWKAVLYRVFSCFMLTFTLVTYVVTGSIDIYMNFGDIEKNMETSCITITLLAAVYKAMKILTQRQKIQRLMDKFDEPYFSCVSKANGKHLLKAMHMCNVCGKLLLLAALATSVIWGAFPLFDKSDEFDLPFRAWFPWDRSVRSTFNMLYVFQVISMDISATIVTSQDVLMCSIVILICGQLDLLYSKISTVGTDDQALSHENGKREDEINNIAGEKPDGKVSKAEDAKLQLRRCILHHKEIINIIEEVESLFSDVIFVQFFGSCIVICATAFQLSVTKFSMKYVSMLLYMSTLLGELFMFCYPGNELMLKSQLISDAAYKTRWYEQDLPFRKMLIILMERSKRPIKVTAGRILPLTLATLTSILRSSYSYYAILHTLHDE